MVSRTWAFSNVGVLPRSGPACPRSRYDSPGKSVPAPLVVVPPQELGDFEFDGFLEHQLSTQPDGFGKRSLSGGRAEKLFSEDLAGKLAFHSCLSLSVLPAQLESAPSWFLQEA